MLESAKPHDITMTRILLGICLLTLSACCSQSCFDYPVYGADEFVMDSYCIQEGRLAILEMQGECVPELPCEAMEEYKDSIAEDDILNIVFYHPKRADLVGALNGINREIGFRVKQGMVDIPDIPPIEVQGLTLDEARDKLQEEFRKQVTDIELFVNYRDRLSRKVELAGLVDVPSIPVDGKIRLFETLSLAGIPSPVNWFRSYVLRDGCPLPIDMHRLMNMGDMCQNIVMRGGDRIFIADPADSKVMVMGEVGVPMAINVPYGFISLREAIVTSHGIPFTGNKRCIQVIRGSLICPKVYWLSWEHIIGLPNSSLLLMPGDTVYVAEKPITKWNRFISQVMPSIHGFQAGYLAYKVFNPD